MNNLMKYIIIAVLVFGLGGVLYFSGSQSDDADGNQVEAIDWDKTYDQYSKHPYGTFFMRKILEVGLDGHEVSNINVAVQDYFKYDSLKLEGANITYMFIGKSLNLYDHEVDSLLQFASLGNQLFIAAENLPVNLLKTLFENYDAYDYFSFTEDTSVALTYENSTFNTEFVLKNQIKDNLKRQRWRNINYGIDYNHSGEVLGKAGSRPCYLKFKIGAGTVLLHTIPQAFTNRVLSLNEGRNYVEKAISFFPKSTILWDNYTKYVYDDGLMTLDYGDKTQSNRSGGMLGDFKSLHFLLKNKALRWGYGIILMGMFLYLIFKGKREQKIIPTMELNHNSSLEFTETLARLYLKQNQHNKLIVHLGTIFKNKIRTRYYIQYSDGPLFIERLSKKSGVDQEEIKALLNFLAGGSNTTKVSDEYLVNLYKKLNDFYKKAK